MFGKVLMSMLALTCSMQMTYDVSFEKKETQLIQKEAVSDDGFDEENVTLRFLNISDTHIGFGNNDALLHRLLAKAKSMYTFDLVTHNGDITQDGKKEQVQEFKKVFESYFDPTVTPLMFCYGNHDTCWNGCMNVGEFYEAFGEEYFTKDLEKDRSKTGSRHMIVNGYHFFSIEMRSYGPNNNNISLEDENWIRNQLKEITKANPNQYVFVSTHSPAKNTALGSNDDDSAGVWGSSQTLRNLFADFPQVVNLSGHTHYAPNSNRFMTSTGNFVSIVTPSTSDFTFNNLSVKEWPDGSLGTVIPDSRTYSYGQIIEVDKNGSIKVIRYDFKHDDFVREPIVLQAPDEDLNHLTPINDKYRRKINQKPTFKEGAKVEAFYKSETEVQINYPRFDDDGLILYYTITITDLEGNEKFKVRTVSHFELYPNLSKMPEKLSFVFSNFKDLTSYRVSIVAHDEWDADSEPLVTEIKRDIMEDKVKAANLEEKITDLMLEEEITQDFKAQIDEIRKTYNSYDYLTRQFVSNYEQFVQIETEFYNTFYLNEDVQKFALPVDQVYSNAPVSSRGGFYKGAYGGVTFNWDIATFNNSVGINQGIDIRDFHMCFSNTYFNSSVQQLGFIISNDIQVLYKNKESFYLFIDFQEGTINYLEDGIVFKVGETSLLKYDNLMHTPWEMKMKEEEENFRLTFVTVQGEYETTFDKKAITSLSGLTNFENCFISLSPYGSHVSCKIDVISMHDGSCDKRVNEGGGEVDQPSTSTSVTPTTTSSSNPSSSQQQETSSNDGKKASGCNGNLSSTLPVLTMLLFFVTLFLRKRKTIYNG